MTLLDTHRPTNDIPSVPRTVLVDDGHGLVLVRCRRRDLLLARLRADSLDRQLAGGTAAETSRLLATRAALLTDPRARRVLAHRWDELVARAGRPALPNDPHVPVARAHVHDAEDAIARLSAALRSERPAAAAGVAAARLLLTDGAGPVYHRHRAGDALTAAVHRVLAAL